MLLIKFRCSVCTKKIFLLLDCLITFPSFLSALTIVLCMYCLSQVMKTISAGYTYATFAGLCIIATTILGILRFNQWPNFYGFIGLIFIIIGVLIVNLLGKN